MTGLPPQDVKDLLHRLSTESTKVLAVFFNSQIVISVIGTIEMVASGAITLRSATAGNPGILESSGLTAFMPFLLSVPCEFADPRLFDNGPFAGFFREEVRFEFGLTFIFPDGSILVFMEIKEIPSTHFG